MTGVRGRAQNQTCPEADHKILLTTWQRLTAATHGSATSQWVDMDSLPACGHGLPEAKVLLADRAKSVSRLIEPMMAAVQKAPKVSLNSGPKGHGRRGCKVTVCEDDLLAGLA